MFADPVQGDVFFNRHENLELMKKRISGLKKGYRQNVALLGQKLIGKSSLLLQLINELNTDNEILPIYLEVRPERLHEFGKRFTGALLYYYFRKETRPVSEKIDALLEKARDDLPRTTEGILRIEKLFGKRSRDQILSSLFDLLPILCEEGGKSCIMILDEFQELGSLNVKNPFVILGQKIMSQKEVEKKLDGFSINKTCMKFLFSIANGHPFYLDSFCREMKRIMNERKMKEASYSVAAEAISMQLFSPISIIYQYLNDFLKGIMDNRTPQDLEMLLAIADGNKKSSEISRIISKSTAQTTRKLEKLMNADIILKRGKVYDFCDPLLKWWIKSVYRSRQESFEPVMEGKGKLELCRQVEDLMSLYITQEKAGVGERLRNLFKLFRNEVVEIAGKTLKLPKFSNISTRTAHGQELPVVGSIGKTYWVADFSKAVVSESAVRAFLAKLSSFRGKVGRKLLICLAGIETDAKLLAKEEGIWLWDLNDLNFILDLYEQPKMS
jgi:AAA+ ATPase superfamily predicted ATPase